MSRHTDRSLPDVLLVGAPKVVNGLGTIALNLVLLRYFGVEQFGAYSLAIASILLFDAILGSAVDMGVLRIAPLQRGSDADDGPTPVERAAVGFKLALGSASALVIAWLAAPLAGHFFQDAAYTHLVYLSTAAIVAMLLLRSAQVHLQVGGHFTLYALVDVAHFGLKFGGIAVLIASGAVSPARALAFFVLGPVCGLAVFVAARGVALFRVVPWNRTVLVELLSHVKWFLLTFCLASLLARIDLFLLSSWGSLADVGILSAAYVLALGFELVGSYLAIVYTPKVVPLCREGRFGTFYRRFQSRLLLACVGLFVLGVAFMTSVGSELLPPSFASASTIFLILLPGALGALATFPMTLAFVMFVKPRFIFTMDCLSLPLLVASYAWVIPRHGALGAALVTSAGRLFKALVTQFVAWRQTRELENSPDDGGFVAATPESWQAGGAS